MSKAVRKRLEAEADRLEEKASKIRRRITEEDTVGWRAILSGDEYDYGTYANYLFKDHGSEAHALAKAAVKEHGCGFVERVMRGKEKHEGIIS